MVDPLSTWKPGGKNNVLFGAEKQYLV